MKYFVTSKISDNIHETPEGYLVCVGVRIARTGEQVYGPGETPLEGDSDGRVVIDRSASEVFRPETIASFEGKPVTLGHPTEDVGPGNWSTLSKGVLQNVRRGTGTYETDLITDILVTDGQAIARVKRGLREVSCGYDAKYVQTGPGRGIQTEIVGNHLALVDEGRAGAAYAIHDHKGKDLKMSLKAKITAIFAKAQDDAIAAATADAAEPAAVPAAAPASAGGYDEIAKMVKDLGSKIDAMGPKPKDASSQPTASAPAEVVATDEGGDMEARMAKLEAMMEKLMSGASADADMEGDDDDMTGDADEDDDMTGDAEEDDDKKDKKTGDSGYLVGDTAARVEILAPGLKLKKDAKNPMGTALVAAYATADGRKVIDSLTGGKKPDFKSPALAKPIFIAASELLKRDRSSALARTKTSDFRSFTNDSEGGEMTPEKLNEIHAKHYAGRTG